MRILSFSTMRRTCAPWKEILFAVAFVRIHGGRKPHLTDTFIEVDYIAIDYQASPQAFKRSNYSGEASQNARPLLSNTSEEAHAILLQTANHSQSLQTIVNADNIYQTFEGEEEQKEAKTSDPPRPDGIKSPEVPDFSQYKATSPDRTYCKCMEGDSELVHRGTEERDGVVHYNKWHPVMEKAAKRRCAEYGPKCAAVQVVREGPSECTYEFYSRCVNIVCSKEPSSLFFKKYGYMRPGPIYRKGEQVAVIRQEDGRRFPAKVVEQPGQGDSSYKVVFPKALQPRLATETLYDHEPHAFPEEHLVKWETYTREKAEAEAFEAAGGYTGKLKTFASEALGVATEGLSTLPEVAGSVGATLRPLAAGLSEVPAAFREYVSPTVPTEYSPPADPEEERIGRSITFVDDTTFDLVVVFSHNPIGVTFDPSFHVTRVSGNAKELNVQKGWEIRSVGPVDVDGQDYNSVLKLMDGLSAALNYYTSIRSILFSVDGAPDQYKTFERQPLGIELNDNLEVVRVQKPSSANSMGVHPGWRIKTVGGVVVEGQNLRKVVMPALVALQERSGPPPSRYRASPRR